jgi:hypothetical protein
MLAPLKIGCTTSKERTAREIMSVMWRRRKRTDAGHSLHRSIEPIFKGASTGLSGLSTDEKTSPHHSLWATSTTQTRYLDLGDAAAMGGLGSVRWPSALVPTGRLLCIPASRMGGDILL